MSIIDTLITNRTQADVDALLALYAKPKAMWTADEWNEFLLGNYRGAYNASDMNRVLDALDYLAERVAQFGYRKPQIKRPSITEKTVVESTSRLPDGYTELEYIRSTGEQYVNSKFKPTGENMRVVMDFEYTAEHDEATLYGSQTASTKFSITAGGAPSFFVGSSLRVVTLTTSLNVRYVMDAHAKDGTLSVKLNDVESVASYSGELDKTLELSLFGNNINGNTSQLISAKVFSGQIYDNDILSRDYVPCLNPSNEVGLYDIVNGVFYGNAGTGVFVAGEELENVGGVEIITTVRDYYKIGDRPPVSELAQYLDNVSRVRNILEVPEDTPAVPADISQRILIEEANNIEIILTAVEMLLNRIALSWVYSGEVYSGEV